jgi:hypothetical protein
VLARYSLYHLIEGALAIAKQLTNGLLLSVMRMPLLFLGILIVMASLAHSAKAADVSPIVDQGWLLGGSSKGKWLSAEDTAKAIKGGESYQLCTLTQFLGKVEGGEPTPNPHIEVGPEFGITFKPTVKTQEPVVAVAGTWPVMPRQPRLISEDLQPYVEAAKEVLQSKGITDPQVMLTQVIEIDLDGDGINEVLVSATHYTMAHLSDLLNDGDYSMLFLQKKAKGAVCNIPIAGIFKAASRPEPGLAKIFRVTGLVDADGDGVMEMVANYTYYEGGGAELYQLKGDQMGLVLSEDWGA